MQRMNNIVYEINIDILFLRAYLLQLYFLLLVQGEVCGGWRLVRIMWVTFVGVLIEGGFAGLGLYVHPFFLFAGMVSGILLQVYLLYGRTTYAGGCLLARRCLPAFLCMGGGGMLYLSFSPYISVIWFWGFLHVLYLIVRKLLPTGGTRHIYSVRLFAGEKCFLLNALYDTGNRLYEPISGKYVCVVKEEVFCEMLKEYGEVFFRYVPYRSMGKTHGGLRAIAVEKMEILTEGGWSERRAFYVAEGTRDVIGKEYDMILHQKAK